MTGSLKYPMKIDSVTIIFKSCDRCNVQVPDLLALSANGLSLLFQLSHLALGHSRFFFDQNIQKVTNRTHNGPQRSNTESPTI